MAALLISTASSAAPQNSLPTTASTGVVEGYVRRAETREGLEGVAVALVGDRDNPDTLLAATSVRTDNKGHFVFRDVRPSSYRVMARLDGYYPPAWELGGYSSDPRFTVAAGQRIDNVALELIPMATISGSILGADGEPLVGAIVIAGRYYYDQAGRRELSLMGMGRGAGSVRESNMATTDDRGEYRLFQLTAGEYYVGTAYRPDTTGTNPPVYYPGTLDEAAATAIVATGGTDRSGISFRLPPRPNVATFTISGEVVGPPTLVEKPVEVLYLVSRDGTKFREDRRNNVAGDRNQGRFQIRGVPPGAYDLYPQIGDGPNRGAALRTRVVVSDRDVENVRIPITTGVDLQGRMLLEGTWPSTPYISATFQEYSPELYLESEDGVPQDFLIPNQQPPDRFIDPATGGFTFRGLLPGKYFVPFNTILPDGVYFADVRQSGKSVFDEGITIGAATPDPFEIVFKSDGIIVEGIVQDSSFARVKGAVVVLVPEPSRRGNRHRYRSMRSDAEGRFRFQTAVAPGEYKIFAWTRVSQNAWLNADFMTAYERFGSPIRIGGIRPSPITVTVISEPGR
jgi:hypothetical protein